MSSLGGSRNAFRLPPVWLRLASVSDHAADLMSIGAFDSGTQALFGHGAGTRHILAHMTTPVLFSH